MAESYHILLVGWLGVYSGLVNTAGVMSRQGTNGEYWSSIFYDTTYVFRLYFGTSVVNPEIHSATRPFGIAVRCVLG